MRHIVLKGRCWQHIFSTDRMDRIFFEEVVLKEFFKKDTGKENQEKNGVGTCCQGGWYWTVLKKSGFGHILLEGTPLKDKGQLQLPKNLQK